jgi:beta-mannosidase
MTTGPWKPVSFHCYENRIFELDVRTQVSESLDVKLTAKFSFEKKKGFASFVLHKPDGSEEVSAPKMATDDGVSELTFDFPSGHLQLWYPVSQGEQPLYTVEVQITDLASLDTRLLQECLLNVNRTEMFSTNERRRLEFDVPVLCKRN